MSASFFIQTSYFYRLIYLKCLGIQQLNMEMRWNFDIIVKKLEADLPTINLYLSKRSLNTSPSVQTFVALINDFFHLNFK